MVLPKKKTEPSFDIHAYNWLIYGQPGIGKSSFAAQFDEALFIPTEPGLEALSVFKATDKECITSWADFIDICKEIQIAKEAGGFNFKVVVIDIIDNLYQFCQDHVCGMQSPPIKHPSDLAYGKGFNLVNTEFKRVINKLSSLTKLVFVSHAMDRDIETRTMKITKTMPTMAGQGGNFINGFVGIIGYISTDPSDESKRIIHFRGHEALVAKDHSNRLGSHMEFDFVKIKNKFEGKDVQDTKEQKT